jgi:GT2 family glycosyltransferase
MWWYHQLPDIDKVSTCFFALGGQAAFSRSKYLELGGFDELLWPLYHEDIDLSYRAWRRGWRVLYEPSSVLYHLGGATSAAKYKRDELRRIVVQNTFLFQWKNIDDPAMRAEHNAWLAPRLARAVLQRDWPFLNGFRSALGRRKRAAQQRAADQSQRIIPDSEAFRRIMAGIDGNIDAAIA